MDKAKPNAAPDADQSVSASRELQPHVAGALHQNPGGTDQELPFGANLEPVLRAACEDRLSDISWFRADWQRGGAATGYAVYRGDDGEREVVVKLPVPPVERLWLERLQPAEEVAPRLFAEGQTLAGYDIAWVVMERLPHGPLSPAWGGAAFDLLIDALCRFYAAADPYTADVPPRQKDWEGILKQAREAVGRAGVPQAQRWKTALKKAQRKLDGWIETWLGRPIDGWCHGDVHMPNAMTRRPAPEGPALLLDFALTRPGSWIEDAVNFEQIYWSQRDRLEGRKICSQIAKTRKQMGLAVDPDWSKLAEVKRRLIAMSTPAKLVHMGDPVHLQAALEMLEG